MAIITTVEEVEDITPTGPVHPTSFIYLALYDYMSNAFTQDVNTVVEWPPHRLSWRLIPSKSPTAPKGEHEIFGIHNEESSIVASDNQHIEDPLEGIRAFIRFPVRTTKSHDDVVGQIDNLSQRFITDAIDDGWQEWEWVYNVFETLEILDFLDDSVTDDWQYTSKPKMEVFKEKILRLAQDVYKEGPPETRVADFPLSS